jgi:hypothetical protein
MRGEDPAAWSRALADPAWLASSQLLKDEPNSSWVRRATLNGRDVVVKCRYLNTTSRWLKSALGYGHGDKHWRGAAVLASRRIETARPIVLARACLDLARAEILVIEAVSGRSLLEELRAIGAGGGLTVRDQHTLAALIARQIASLTGTANWMWNRDHKPSNLIVRRDASGQLGVAVIDCVGIRGGSLRPAWMPWCRMFASLLIEPIGCGVPPRLALRMRVLREFVRASGVKAGHPAERSTIRLYWRTTERLIRRHGDPRPKTNPLVSPPSPSSPRPN